MGNITKIIFVYFLIAAFLFTSGLPGTQSSTLLNYFANVQNVSGDANNITQYTVSISENATAKTGLNQSAGGTSTSPLTFLNPIGMVWAALQLLASVFFAPMWTLQSMGAPSVLVLIAGLAPIVLILLGVISWIRGVEL